MEGTTGGGSLPLCMFMWMERGGGYRYTYIGAIPDMEREEYNTN